MNFDLVVCGVGGQGVLTMAGVIDHAVHEAGLQLKQSEVHGMAQRGGAVSAFVRLSDHAVASDLIAQGCAQMILSVEPMEALRYTPLLRPDGWIVTDITPMLNVDNYPSLPDLYKVLFSAPRLVALDAARLAHKAGSIKVQNTVMLGAAAMHLPLSGEFFENQLRHLFGRKGDRIVSANLNAFRMGDAASRFAAALLQAGVASEVVSRAVARLGFEPKPVATELVAQWHQRLMQPDAAAIAAKIFAAEEAYTPDAVTQGL
ncbi:indolepyruvate oxidoreductase subunit beta [Rhodoferax sp.]|uniref:indolepyruvate oxidoreductase subunit beta n=1 Tax=Rhodoferax sp. TaxID=50421 RepID=UPI00261447E0|nr:indolepyruvate oxidoreductase subunit beta [Rhodoferax sp.]MDD2808281.1 indolepyruvate oxidoreductase subunit beta [Rhodoferax sp.]MDD4944101.1 indolepyruvate oxidoreductase subunit beta [Rhodoferax sp.]